MDSEISSVKQTGAAAKRRMRGRKLKRSGLPQRHKVSEAILLSNLPLLCTTLEVENLIKQTSGLTKENSFFYTEMLRTPGVLYTEALICFGDKKHLILVYQKLNQAITILGFPYEISLQTLKNRGRGGISFGYQMRYKKYMQSINAPICSDTLNESETLERMIMAANENMNRERDMEKHNCNNKIEPEVVTESREVSLKEHVLNNSATVISNADMEAENAHDEIAKDSLEEGEINDDANDFEDEATKTEQAAHSEDSCDSTKTIVLTEHARNLDKIITVKQEPIDFENTNDAENVAVTVKQEPQSIIGDQTPFTEMDVSNIAINEILKDFDPSAIELKQEPMETEENPWNRIDSTKIEAATSIEPNKKDFANASTSSNESHRTMDKSKSEEKSSTASKIDKVHSKSSDSKKTSKDKVNKPSKLTESAEKSENKTKSSEHVKDSESIRSNDLNSIQTPLDKSTKSTEKSKKDKSSADSLQSHVNKASSSGKDKINSTKSADNTKSTPNKTSSTAKDRVDKPSNLNISINKNTSSEYVRSSDSPQIRSNKSAESVQSQIVEIDESDEKHCKVLHVKNLPVSTLRHMIILLKDEILKECAQIAKEHIFVHIMQDAIERNLTSQALVKLSTHHQAVTVCKVLNGCKIGNTNKTLEVNLDIGHKVLKDYMKFSPTTRKRKRKDDVEFEENEHVAAKLSKIESDWLSIHSTRSYLPAEERCEDDYGFRPVFLMTLGLKPPLRNTIIVKQLHELVDEDKLYEVFSLAGDIKQLQYCKLENKARIEYDHPVEAVQAIYMFHKQKLFDKEIVINMEKVFQPRPLPLGLSGINKGFGKNGNPLNAVRTNVELKNIHEILYDLGKMNKFESNNITDPFITWYGKRAKGNIAGKKKVVPSTSKNNSSVSNDLPSVSFTSNDILSTNLSKFNDTDRTLGSNEINQNNVQPNDDNARAIEELGAILISRGLIPQGTDCKEACNILAALKSTPQTYPKMISNTVPNHANVSPSFAPNPMGASNPMGKPITTNAVQTLRWEHAHNQSVANIPVRDALLSQNKIDERKKREDYQSRDPRLEKEREKSNQNEGNNLLIFRNLPPSVNQVVLTKKMREIGELHYCEMSAGGSAVVCFRNFQDSDRCLRLFHRSKVDGQIIEVVFV